MLSEIYEELEQLLLNVLLEIVWKEEINYGVLKLVSKLFKMRINCGVEGGSIGVNEWTTKWGLQFCVDRATFLCLHYTAVSSGKDGLCISYYPFGERFSSHCR